MLLSLGVQQFVGFTRGSVNIGVIAVAAIAGKLRSSVHAVAAKTPAKSVTASRIGRE